MASKTLHVFIATSTQWQPPPHLLSTHVGSMWMLCERAVQCAANLHPGCDFRVIDVIDSSTGGSVMDNPNSALTGPTFDVYLRRKGPWYDDTFLAIAVDCMSEKDPDLVTVAAGVLVLNDCLRCNVDSADCFALLSFLALQKVAAAFYYVYWRVGVTNTSELLARLWQSDSVCVNAIAAAFEPTKLGQKGAWVSVDQICAQLQSLEHAGSKSGVWQVQTPNIVLYRFLRGFLLLSHHRPEEARPLLEYCALTGFVPARHLALSAQKQMGSPVPLSFAHAELRACAGAGYAPAAASLLICRLTCAECSKPPDLSIVLKVMASDGDDSTPATLATLAALADFDFTPSQITQLFEKAMSHDRIALHALARAWRRAALSYDQLQTLAVSARAQGADRDYLRLLAALHDTATSDSVRQEVGVQVQQLVQQCGPGIASLAVHLGLISATDALSNRDNSTESEEQVRV